MNELLLWISTLQEGTAASFNRKAAELAPSRASGPAAHRVAEWTLDMLSHCEFGGAASGGWRVAPAVLAAGDPRAAARAVLCGARDPQTVRRLVDAAGGAAAVTPQHRAPDAVTVAAGSNAELMRIASSAGIPLQWSAADAILAASPRPIDVPLEEAPLPTGNWKVTRFSRSRLQWVDADAAAAARARTGLFRFTSDFGRRYILKERGRAFIVDPAVGKYRLFGRRQRALRIDLSRGTATAPLSARPPRLVERALVSCSGALPSIEDGRLVYTGVTPTAAAAVGWSLGR